MLSNKIACFLALVLLLIAVAVAAPTTKLLTIHKNERFCILLPRTPGSDIAENLDNSVSYCSSSTAQVRHGKALPSGFVKTAHYYEPADRLYSQVTGRFDPAAFSLSTSDSGGMASHKLPGRPSCVGFRYFIQFVEPNQGVYCIRCCHTNSNCPTDKGDQGCRVVIPGDYS
ncbi:MAG: hypothetical protein J3Q66DRAFT_402416 [Benniella sp.]|nr:MAG: hypothetical protein J3Q66DRAFT_402416 [Benniella sp.]